jgi:hypothetical protein
MFPLEFDVQPKAWRVFSLRFLRRFAAIPINEATAG